MPCLDLVIIGWELCEEGTRAVNTRSEEEEGRKDRIYKDRQGRWR